MGVFTNIDVQIHLATEKDTAKVAGIVDNFREEIKEHIYKDKPFHVNDMDFEEWDDDSIELKISSGREPNARFHVNCLIKLMQIHKVVVHSFNAEIIQPDNYICCDTTEDFNEIEIKFE
jgi:hypothetical protein